MSQNNPTMGERIRDCRKACGMTQSELAELVGVSTSAIVRYEKSPDDPDYTEPKVKTFKAIASALHVSEDYLLCKTNDPQAISVMSFLLPDDLSELISTKICKLAAKAKYDNSVLAELNVDLPHLAGLVKKKYTIKQVKKLLETFNITVSSLFSADETLDNPSQKSSSPIEIPPDDEILEYILSQEDSEQRQLEQTGVNSTEINYEGFKKFILSVIKLHDRIDPSMRPDIAPWQERKADLIIKCIQKPKYCSMLDLYDKLDAGNQDLAKELLAAQKEFYLSKKDKEAERKNLLKKESKEFYNLFNGKESVKEP